MCHLCGGDKQLELANGMKIPCPGCDPGKFFIYYDQMPKAYDDVPITCQDCGCITPSGKIRCLTCHKKYQETEILCDCGRYHHKAKYKHCFYCNQRIAMLGK